MTPIDQADKASRLARAIAADLLLYHGDRAAAGVLADNLFEVLADEMGHGLQLYRSRLAAELDPHAVLYWRAIVDIVVHSLGHLPSKIW